MNNDGDDYARYVSVLGFLLEAKLVAVSTLALAAIGGLEWQGGIALPANLLIAVELLGDGCDGRIHSTTTESKHEVESRLFLDVVVRQTAAVYVAGEVPSSCLPAKMRRC